MEMTGEFRIPAPRQRVWEGLNDPEVLKQCIPGCQTLEKVSDTEFNGRVVASVGPVRATFGGKVTLSDLDPPQSYTISGEGSGGVAGFAKGGAMVKLAEKDGGTLLSEKLQSSVNGTVIHGAAVASDVVGSESRQQFGYSVFTRSGKRWRLQLKDRSAGVLVTCSILNRQANCGSGAAK